MGDQGDRATLMQSWHHVRRRQLITKDQNQGTLGRPSAMFLMSSTHHKPFFFLHLAFSLVVIVAADINPNVHRER